MKKHLIIAKTSSKPLKQRTIKNVGYAEKLLKNHMNFTHDIDLIDEINLSVSNRINEFEDHPPKKRKLTPLS